MWPSFRILGTCTVILPLECAIRLIVKFFLPCSFLHSVICQDIWPGGQCCLHYRLHLLRISVLFRTPLKTDSFCVTQYMNRSAMSICGMRCYKNPRKPTWCYALDILWGHHVFPAGLPAWHWIFSEGRVSGNILSRLFLCKHWALSFPSLLLLPSHQFYELGTWLCSTCSVFVQIAERPLGRSIERSKPSSKLSLGLHLLSLIQVLFCKTQPIQFYLVALTMQIPFQSISFLPHWTRIGFCLWQTLLYIH